MMGILKQQPVIRRIFLLTFVGLLLPATNRILVVTVIREILAVIPVNLTISVLLFILWCRPFESVVGVSRGRKGFVVLVQ